MTISKHAYGVMESLLNGDCPRQDVNPGVAQKLSGLGFIHTYDAPSPYAAKKGEHVNWIRLTETGRSYIWNRRKYGDEI